MNKRSLRLREDFFDQDKIRDVRAEEDGAEILCAYLALRLAADDNGYIADEDVAFIASDLEYTEDELRGLIDRIIEVELGMTGMSGFWLTSPEDFE